MAFIQKESRAFFGKYLYASLLRQDPRYYPSTSSTFLGQSTYAASRILITRNDSGERALNSSYFLTPVAIATAYRPYWARSTSATVKTFGSTIGSDVGSTSSTSLGLASGKCCRRSEDHSFRLGMHTAEPHQLLDKQTRSHHRKMIDLLPYHL